MYIAAALILARDERENACPVSPCEESKEDR